MSQRENFNPYTDTDKAGCQTCHENSSVPTRINQVYWNSDFIKKNPVYKNAGCSTEWIDSALLKYKFGIDFCNGVAVSRWIPGWLIEYCPKISNPSDLGYPDPCDKNLYYKIMSDGFVYAVTYDCHGKQIGPMKQLKSWKIQDCAIESIDASKIINACKIFTTSKLAKPIDDYLISNNGIDTIDPTVQFLPVVITKNCELKTAYTDKIARRGVLPSLACIVDYDVALDVAKINLSRVIDNKTIRVIQNSGNCDKIFSYTYAGENITGDGTDINPLIARVKTDNIIVFGDGTTANPITARVKTDGVTAFGDGTTANPIRSKTYADPNQFNGDGQSSATQYSLKPCVIPNTFFTVYAKSIVFDQPLKASNNQVFTQLGNSKRIRSTVTWTLGDLPTPCVGKKLFGQLTIRVKSSANIISFPVHLFGAVQVSNGSWLMPGDIQNFPQMQVSSGTTAEYGDSRGYTADITYFVTLNGGNTTFTLEPTVAFPNGIDPATTTPTNPLFPQGVPNDSWFESIAAQFVLLGVI